MPYRNSHVRRFLYNLRAARKWTQKKLADKVRLPRSIVSEHLTGSRAVRPNHLVKYLRILDDDGQRQALVDAWVADNLRH